MSAATFSVALDRVTNAHGLDPIPAENRAALYATHGYCALCAVRAHYALTLPGFCCAFRTAPAS